MSRGPASLYRLREYRHSVYAYMHTCKHQLVMRMGHMACMSQHVKVDWHVLLW